MSIKVISQALEDNFLSKTLKTAVEKPSVAKANVELSQATLANEKCRFMDKLLKVIKNRMSKNNHSSKMVEMLRQELLGRF